MLYVLTRDIMEYITKADSIMAFKKNKYEQITLHDKFLFSLTDREKKVLEKSWA